MDMDMDRDLQDKIDRLARALRERITAPDGSQGQHRPLEDEAWYDEVRIVTVPRFKTSGMSGDEWRTSAVAQFLRKGEVVASERFSDVKAAAACAGARLLRPPLRARRLEHGGPRRELRVVRR